MNLMEKSKFRAWHGIVLALVAAPVAIWGLESSVNGETKAQLEQPVTCAQADAGTMQMRRMVAPPEQKPSVQPAKAQSAQTACQPANVSAM